MKEVYDLNRETLPTMPIPHDCAVKDIYMKDQTLVFVFEEDISDYDSVKCMKRKAKSLILRFHLPDACYSLCQWHKPGKLFFKNGYYKALDPSRLFGLCGGEISYLEHFVGRCSMIIKLFAGSTVVLQAGVDIVEYDWIE